MELLHTDRHEWERIIRRLIIPAPVKGTALLLATYADADGSRIFPGIARLIRVSGKSDRQVRRDIQWLTEHGLLLTVFHGNRHAGQCKVYRLTVPQDVTERLPMVDPNELMPVPLMRAGQCAQPVDNPVDNPPQTPETGPQPRHADACLSVIPDMSIGHMEHVYRSSMTAHQPIYQPLPTQSAHLEKVSCSSARVTTRDTADLPGDAGYKPANAAYAAWRERRRRDAC